MRRNSLILQKKFSTRWRHLYISKSQGIVVTRLALGGITAAAPQSSRSARIASLSEALSARSALKSRSVRSGATPALSCPEAGRTARDCPAHRPARRSLSRRGTARWPDFVSPLSRRSRAGALGRWFHRRSRTRSPRRPIRPRRSDRTRQPWPIGESAESSSCRKPREGRARAPRHAQSREPLRRNAGCPLPSGPHPRLFPEQAVRSAPIDHHAVLDGPRSPPSGNLELVTLKQISMDLRTPYRF